MWSTSTRTLVSGSPRTSARMPRTMNGVCVEIHMVSRSSLHCATQMLGSMYAGVGLPIS